MSNSIEHSIIQLDNNEIKIVSWISKNPGKGESEKELRKLKKIFTIIRVVDVHQENKNAVEFWKKMREKELINSIQDDNGIFV